MIGERVRPRHGAGDDEQGHERLDAPAAPHEPADPRHRRDERGRRGDREGLAVDPRRSDEDGGGTAERCAGQVEQQTPLAAPPRPPQAGQRRCDDHGDQDVGKADVIGAMPEVARRPDAEDLERAEGMDQVPQLAAARERGGAGIEEVAHEEQRGHREGECEHGERRRDTGEREAAQPEPCDQGEDEDRRDPDAAVEAEHTDQSGGGRRQRNEAAGAHTLPQGAWRQRGHEHDQPHRCHLLDAAPERVGVQQRRLRGDERGHGAHGGRADHASRKGVEAEGQHRPEECDVRLEQPGRVRSQELVHHAQGRKCSSGVASAAPAEEQRRLVRRGRKAREVAPVLEQAVGERQPGRGVVQRDIARERRAAREDHGAPNAANAAMAHATGHPAPRPGRQGKASPRPATASATIAGVVRPAVVALVVVKSATTTIAAKPSGNSSSRGSCRPAARSTRSPQPSESSPRTSGSTSQAMTRLIELASFSVAPGNPRAAWLA